jgi:hypothetical protein
MRLRRGKRAQSYYRALSFKRCTYATRVFRHFRYVLYWRLSLHRGFIPCSQPFDLTDLDWSPELWIACHDEDEQNARLATHVWDDNGLDVPESFLPQLLNYLGG